MLDLSGKINVKLSKAVFKNCKKDAYIKYTMEQAEEYNFTRKNAI